MHFSRGRFFLDHPVVVGLVSTMVVDLDGNQDIWVRIPVGFENNFKNQNMCNIYEQGYRNTLLRIFSEVVPYPLHFRLTRESLQLICKL